MAWEKPRSICEKSAFVLSFVFPIASVGLFFTGVALINAHPLIIVFGFLSGCGGHLATMLDVYMVKSRNSTRARMEMELDQMEAARR